MPGKQLNQTEIEQDVKECREKLKNYYGNNNNKKKITIALTKKLALLIISLSRKADQKSLEEGVRLSQELIQLQSKLNYIENQAQSEHRLAALYFNLGKIYQKDMRNLKAIDNFDKACQSISQAIQLDNQDNHHKRYKESIIHYYIGFCVFNSKAKNDTAIDYLIKQYELHKELGAFDKAASIAFHISQDQPEVAKAIYLKNIDCNENIDLALLAKSYAGLGSIYLQRAINPIYSNQCEEQLVQTIEYFRKAVALEPGSRSTPIHMLITTLGELGLYYKKTYERTSDERMICAASNCYFEAMEIAHNNGETRKLGKILCEIGSCYLLYNNDSKMAIAYTQRGITNILKGMLSNGTIFEKEHSEYTDRHEKLCQQNDPVLIKKLISFKKEIVTQGTKYHAAITNEKHITQFFTGQRKENFKRKADVPNESKHETKTTKPPSAKKYKR